ncbi:MAG: MEDS domain-containing protein [Actinoplanes sp.]
MLGRLALGDHVCWTVDDEASKLDIVATCVRDGLAGRERVLYLGDDPAGVLDAIEQRGVCTSAALAAGQLQAVTAEASYLAAGHFDPDASFELWTRAKRDALAAGFRGVRAIGDMNWAARGIPGAERLPDYEVRINPLFTDGRLAGVCVYDRRRFEPMWLRRVAWAHPGAAGPDLPFDPDSSLRLRRTSEPYVLWVSGEADLSNRAALAVVLDDLRAGLSVDREVTVDLTGLRFADLAAARILVDALAGGPGRVRLTGCSAPMNRLLTFHGVTV